MMSASFEAASTLAAQHCKGKQVSCQVNYIGRNELKDEGAILVENMFKERAANKSSNES